MYLNYIFLIDFEIDMLIEVPLHFGSLFFPYAVGIAANPG